MLVQAVAALRLQALAVQLVCPAEVPVAVRIVENHVGLRPLTEFPQVGPETQRQEASVCLTPRRVAQREVWDATVEWS